MESSLFMTETPIWNLPGTGNPINSICYNNYGNQVAFSSSPGEISIYSIYDGTPLTYMQQNLTSYQFTNIHFHPVEDNLLLATSKDGFILLFDVFSNEVLSFSRHLGSNLLAMNIDVYGETFAIGCADGSIRIYDLENLQRTKALVKMTGRGSNVPTASLINTLLYYPDDPNVIISTSGIDKILFWDLRTGNSERSLSGVHVHGQGSVDAYQNDIIVASFRDSKQLEVYDYSTTKKIRDINFDNQQSRDAQTSSNENGSSGPLNDNANSSKPSNLNCVSVAKNGLDFVAGGAVTNICQSFALSNYESIGCSQQSASPVTSVSMSPLGSSFVCGMENGVIQTYAIRARNF